MNLGETIYRLRTQKNMSQGDLANALDVSRQSVSKWETGNAVPDLEKLIKMSKLFAVTLDQLVGAESIQTEVPPSAPEHPPAHPVKLRELFGILMLSFGVVALLASLLIGSPWIETCVYIALLLSTLGSVCCWPGKWMIQAVVFLIDGIFLFILALYGDPLSALIFSAPFWVIGLVWLYCEEQAEDSQSDTNRSA